MGFGGMSSTAAAELWRNDKVAASRAPNAASAKDADTGVTTGCKEGIQPSVDVSRAALPLPPWGKEGKSR